MGLVSLFQFESFILLNAVRKCLKFIQEVFDAIVMLFSDF